MKKLKGIVLVMFCCLFTGVGLLSACSSDEETYSTMLDSISVNANGAKTTYALGEEFSSDGLVVTAETSINNVAQSTITVTDYTVDSSNFDSSVIGTYTIYVSYALETNTSAVQHAEYDVTVTSSLPEYANMKVEYSGDQQLAYSLSGVTIDLSSSLITVTSYIGESSTDFTEATVTDYTLYYCVNGGEEKAVQGTSITATEAATYCISARKEYTKGTESFEMEGQFLVYVVDEVVSIAKNAGGTTSFDYGATDIGSDWTYTLTYATGTTETISYDDVAISAINTKTGSQTATVTYVEKYTGVVNGVVTEVSNNKTLTVDYSINSPVSGASLVYSFVYDNWSDYTGGGFSVGQDGSLNGSNGILSLTGDGYAKESTTSATYTPESGSPVTYSGAVQMGSYSASKRWVVDLTDFSNCTVTIKIYASTAKNGDTRTISLRDSSGSSIQTSSDFTDNSVAYLTEWTLTAGNTYYIGGSNSINYYQIDITVTFS